MKKRKLLIILLALCMVLSMTSMTAFAVEPESMGTGLGNGAIHGTT